MFTKRTVVRIIQLAVFTLIFLAALGAILDAVKAPAVVTGIPAAAGALSACWDEPNQEMPGGYEPICGQLANAPAGSVHFTAYPAN